MVRPSEGDILGFFSMMMKVYFLMTAPYMPLFISDYLADTAHLTTIEHGAYLLLIMNYWQTGKPLPNDDKKLARICRLQFSKFIKMKSPLAELFTCTEHNWVHSRIEKELAISREKSAKSRLSAESRWKKDEKSFDAFALRTQCYKYSKVKNKKENEKEKDLFQSPDGDPDQLKNSELKKQAIEVLNFLNQKTGKVYRPVDSNLKLIMARLRSGISVQDCFSLIAKKSRDWKDDPKMFPYLRPATLFNATKFEQYFGELIPVEGDQ